MDQQAKTSRKRVANFTADEKALLAQLIKKKPIIESKQTDGKSVAKKQAAWDLITQEFNSNANVNKRETITLKRAWDNMKSFTRKARATERGNLIRTGGGPQLPPPAPQDGAIISMVEEAAPVIICELNNSFDSDGTILCSINNTEVDTIDIGGNETVTAVSSADTSDINKDVEFTVPLNATQNITDNSAIIKADPVRRPSEYIRREAVTRIKHLENKKNLEIKILKTQLEVEEIRKRSALLEEERNKMLLEKTKIELKKINT